MIWWIEAIDIIPVYGINISSNLSHGDYPNVLYTNYRIARQLLLNRDAVHHRDPDTRVHDAH